MNFPKLALSAALIGALACSPAMASLAKSYQFNGKGNWSLDAAGSNSTPVGNISAVIPTGSTVEKAFLYSSLYTPTSTPSVTFDGTVYGPSSWTALGVTAGLQAFRTDVTSQVAAKVGGGSASPFSFSVDSETPNTLIDGEALAIVYSNPAEKERTIAFLDGFSATTGDSTALNLAEALTGAQLADPTFEAMLSLGIGFGFQPSGQVSTVDVNGQRMTSCAGGYDDGIGTNGGLITIGGIGDDFTTNPAANCSDSGGPLVDDEAYTLLPFLTAGDTSITIDTRNPSNDDNIFFAGVNITAVAGVNEPPPVNGNVPAPAGLLLMLAGLGAARLASRRK